MRTLLSPASQRRWRFFRAGGFDQVRLDSGEDIAHLGELDQKLWAALSCPSRGLEFDAKTLELIDADHDGHIRAPEIIATTRWVCSMLKDPGVLVRGGEPLQLADINDATPEGQRLLASARQILTNLGKPEAVSLSTDDTTDAARIFANTKFNGDGIIILESADDPATAAVIQEIINCVGPETDRSGRPGINQAKADAFFASLEGHVKWLAALEADRARILPLGDATAAAWESLKAVQAKVEDYFARCRMASFDARAQAALNRQQEEYLAIAAKDLTIDADEIAGFPLAQVRPGRSLPLGVEMNPAWSDDMAAFIAKAARPLAGVQDELSYAQWLEIVAKLAPFASWNATRPSSYTDKIGEARASEILAGPARQQIADLIVRDKALAPEVDTMNDVNRLVYFRRDLYRLLTNYVNFKEFYASDEMAIFQAGVLYLDQRSCELCVRVDDTAKHAALAPLSRSYLAYCDCVRRGGTEKMSIAAAFTAGDSDNLMVGRNGLFYDRKGNDWDATIVKIIDMPISIRQAFWAPYKRVIRYIEEQIAKRAAAADTAATAGLTTGISQATAAPAPGAPAAAPPPPKKLDVGVIAAMGVAFGAITSAFAVLLNWLSGVSFVYLPFYIILVMLLISMPSMIIAALKLRQRNLGPLLDANGWAINTRAMINIPFGQQLTRRAVLPPGSQRDLFDPYAQSKAGRYWTIAIIAVLAVVLGAWYFGCIEHYLPDVLPKSSYVKAKQEKADKAKADADKAAADARAAEEARRRAATQPAAPAAAER